MVTVFHNTRLWKSYSRTNPAGQSFDSTKGRGDFDGAQRLPIAVPLPRAFLLYFLCLLNLLCLQVEKFVPLPLGGVARGGLGDSRFRSVVFPFHGHEFRDARLLHRHAVQHRAHLHGSPVVRDDDELRSAPHISASILLKRPDVRFVQRRIDFVEDAEGARLVAEHRDQQGQGGQRFFAARKQQNILQALARAAARRYRCPLRRSCPARPAASRRCRRRTASGTQSRSAR